MSLARALIASLAFATSTAVVAEDLGEGLALTHFEASDWVQLDALIGKIAASGERTEDGRFKLYMVTGGLGGHLGVDWGEERNSTIRSKVASYKAEHPDSTFAPVLEAMLVHAAAWRARGHGFSSTVTPEGWALFRERSQEAWNMLLDCKSHSASLPTWYERALAIGEDAGVPGDQLTALFNEGINRFPGYHSLYFTYARRFSPRWGGNYKAADAFVRAQVSAKTNPDGELLYTRLYWVIDQYDNGDPRFFDESLVSWPRMRAGFELMMKQFPHSSWNQANFVAYACRAGDAVSYSKWRPTVKDNQFVGAAPDGISLEVCDARFMRKA